MLLLRFLLVLQCARSVRDRRNRLPLPELSHSPTVLPRLGTSAKKDNLEEPDRSIESSV